MRVAYIRIPDFAFDFDDVTENEKRMKEYIICRSSPRET